ncbi:MAG: hypothetical protein V3W11_04315 [bacterium]
MDSSDNDRLVGWKAIAAAMGRSPTCVRRWALEKGMPVYKLGGVYASRAELEAWERSRRTKVVAPTPAAKEKGE